LGGGGGGRRRRRRRRRRGKKKNPKFDCGVAEDCVLVGYDRGPLGHPIVTLRGNMMPPLPIFKSGHVLDGIGRGSTYCVPR